MKASVFHQHGGPEVLKYEDVPEPKPGSRDVVIQVKAAGCNYNDLWARQGLPGMKFDLPHISGSDAAGVVKEIGSEVTSVKVGQEVVVHPAISCRICEACTRGQEYFCRYFKIWGFQTGPLDGAHAEYARIPEANAVPKPARLSWEEAASIPLVLLTAWHMLVTRARLLPGEDVLVWGAGSGIGSIAIQIGKLIGARVIAVAGTDAKCEKAKALGADHVINHASQDVVAEVRKITNKKGVDVVFEHVGQATWERSIATMNWGGRLVICGNTTGFEAKTDLRFLFNKQLSLLGSHQGSKAELLEGLRLVEAGKIKPVVDRVIPLKDAAEAQRLMESRAQFGKLVLVP
ncbi:MAG: alcohol dehydrogenase [Candidatus Rokubacteria bacterium RIFCSPLOWO2_02_FULL_68_19]|nr:MAG: alcohol dehydrogenase [Candidatus Rokubacteria bacterium RIFCSPLOWO2_02_FULL_68_19]